MRNDCQVKNERVAHAVLMQPGGCIREGIRSRAKRAVCHAELRDASELCFGDLPGNFGTDSSGAIEKHQPFIPGKIAQTQEPYQTKPRIFKTDSAKTQRYKNLSQNICKGEQKLGDTIIAGN